MQRSSTWRRRAFLGTSIAALAVLLAASQAADGYASSRQGPDDDPRLRLRATPRVAFAPASILFVGQLRGGPDDNEELCCATIEWDWGDDTYSESTPDCDPFEPALHAIAEGVTRLPAPILPMTCDEMWRHLPGRTPTACTGDGAG